MRGEIPISSASDRSLSFSSQWTDDNIDTIVRKGGLQVTKNIAQITTGTASLSVTKLPIQPIRVRSPCASCRASHSKCDMKRPCSRCTQLRCGQYILTRILHIEITNEFSLLTWRPDCSDVMPLAPILSHSLNSRSSRSKRPFSSLSAAENNDADSLKRAKSLSLEEQEQSVSYYLLGSDETLHRSPNTPIGALPYRPSLHHTRDSSSPNTSMVENDHIQTAASKDRNSENPETRSENMQNYISARRFQHANTTARSQVSRSSATERTQPISDPNEPGTEIFSNFTEFSPSMAGDSHAHINTKQPGSRSTGKPPLLKPTSQLESSTLSSVGSPLLGQDSILHPTKDKSSIHNTRYYVKACKD